MERTVMIMTMTMIKFNDSLNEHTVMNVWVLLRRKSHKMFFYFITFDEMTQKWIY